MTQVLQTGSDKRYAVMIEVWAESVSLPLDPFPSASTVYWCAGTFVQRDAALDYLRRSGYEGAVVEVLADSVRELRIRENDLDKA